MKKRGTRLYNLIMPIWLLWVFPPIILAVLPANFGIDLLVSWLALKWLLVPERKAVLKKTVWKTWLFGFLADFGGMAFMLLGVLLFPDYNTDTGKWWNYHIANSIAMNPWNNIFSFLWTLAGVAIAAALIYLFNRRICLKNTDLDDRAKRKISLWLAVFTAPYLFFLPAVSGM